MLLKFNGRVKVKSYGDDILLITQKGRYYGEKYSSSNLMLTPKNNLKSNTYHR